MNPRDFKRQLVAMGLLATLPRVARGGDAINAAEAHKIVERLSALDYAAAEHSGMLDVLGVDPDLLKQLSKELKAASCSALLARKSGAKAAAVRKAYELLIQADNRVQELARSVYLDGQAVSESAREAARVVAAQSGQAPRAPKSIAVPELSFSKKGWIWPSVQASVDTVEVYSLFESQLRDVAIHGVPVDAKAHIAIEKLNFTSGGMNLDFVVGNGGTSPKLVRIRNYALPEGLTNEECVAEFLSAAVQHETLLRKPKILDQEINMLRYDLLKLYRLTPSELKGDLKLAIAALKDVDTQKIFEGTAGETGRKFQSLLAAKRIVIEVAQDMQADIAEGQGSAVKRTARKGKKAAAVEKLTVAYKTRANPSRPLYRQKDDGYYYPATYVNSDDSTTLSTTMWMMDPHFMMTHPWYWGATDNSFMAHWMLFEAMSQHHRTEPSPHSFLNQQPYHPNLFTIPVEPNLYSNDADPIRDVWDTRAAAPGSTPLGAGEMLGWNAIVGPGASEDFAPTPTVDTSASSSGWFSSSSSDSSPSSTTGTWDFSSTGSTTTTGSSTTGVFDFTTTGSTTTGFDFTTTGSSTTTGYDSTTTGFDSTTTGFDSTGSSSTGSDW